MGGEGWCWAMAALVFCFSLFFSPSTCCRAWAPEGGGGGGWARWPPSSACSGAQQVFQHRRGGEQAGQRRAGKGAVGGRDELHCAARAAEGGRVGQGS